MFFVWFFAFTSAETEELMSFRFFVEQLPWQVGFADERTFAYTSIVEKVTLVTKILTKASNLISSAKLDSAAFY